MNEPCISIDRAAKRYAIFDGFNCVRSFTPYVDEETAITYAKAWIAERTDKEPEIVYPQIKSFKMSRAKH